ncbi:MAG: FtsX-like permease family protein, partial [Bacteroidota bacterium]
LRQLPFVSDVFYTETVTTTIASNLKKVSYWVLGASIFFIVVAVALILNTIRLALYSNRFLIKNMELVGASWEFISRPYLLRSLKHGFMSALAAIGLLALVLYFATQNTPELQEQLDFPGIAIIFGSLLLLGVLISYLSTFYVVKKYLRMRVDDLY